MIDVEILYQNQINGNAWEISSVVMNPRWSTKRVGAASTMTFEVIPTDTAWFIFLDRESMKSLIEWELGGFIKMKLQGKDVFWGYITKIQRSHHGMLHITAVDQLFYLVKNSDTYVFTNLRADQMIAQIADDFGIKLGALADTGYVIPSMVEDGSVLMDIILKALDLTLINTGNLYTLWDDFGALTLSAGNARVIDAVIGDKSLATAYTFSEDIETETANRIVLVQDNEETLKRDFFMIHNSANETLWGILQHYEIVNEGLNPAQIEARATNLLELKNRPMRSFSVSAIAHPEVRAGVCLYIHLEDIGLQIAERYLVDEVVHDLQKETMELKLRIY